MMLEDEQIYETDIYLMKIEKVSDSFRGILFKKEQDDKSIRFINVIMDRKKLLEELLIKLNFKLSTKILTTTGV